MFFLFQLNKGEGTNADNATIGPLAAKTQETTLKVARA